MSLETTFKFYIKRGSEKYPNLVRKRTNKVRPVSGTEKLGFSFIRRSRAVLPSPLASVLCYLFMEKGPPGPGRWPLPLPDGSK